jgi:hypothetical protein
MSDMTDKFKQPDLNAPRFREKRIGFLNANTIKEFKDKYPLYEKIDNNKLKSIIRRYNEGLWNGVIEFRDGVELPNSLGYLFIGTCSPAKYKKQNIDFGKSNEYGKILKNQNWETDGNIGKIFYTNSSAKYRFKNRELWKFEACRNFKRSVAKKYPEDWTKYIIVQNRYKISHLYKAEKISDNYNEFEL